MCYGSTSQTSRVKLFGLEDFWGNIWELIDGCVTDSSRKILTTTDNFNDSGSGYISYPSGVSSDIGNYMSQSQGTTNTGFVAKRTSSSSSTYYCDYAVLSSSRVCLFGGHWDVGLFAGAFQLSLDVSASFAGSHAGARLMYL